MLLMAMCKTSESLSSREFCLWVNLIDNFCLSHPFTSTSDLWLFDVSYNRDYIHSLSLLYRLEGDSYVQYKAMVMCTGMHLLLLMFEVLACDNLQTAAHSWLLVFIPLIFMALVSVGICIWAVKNERSFEVIYFSFIWNIILKV